MSSKSESQLKRVKSEESEVTERYLSIVVRGRTVVYVEFVRRDLCTTQVFLIISEGKKSKERKQKRRKKAK